MWAIHECPACGSDNSCCHSDIYGADADGNRGQMRTYCICRDCKYEWEEY